MTSTNCRFKIKKKMIPKYLALVKSAVMVTLNRIFSDIIFPVQKTLGNEKSFFCGGVGSCVMAKALDCRFEVSEFELQSRYYIHFQTNTLGRGMNLIIPPTPAMG